MTRSVALFPVVALLLGALPAAAGADPDPLYAGFQDPPSHYRPFVRWWWNGGCVSEAEVLRELDLMKAAGIGGVEINTIQMPEQSIPGMLEDVRCLEWLSPEWNEVVRAATAGARERDMTADLIVGSGWPFGGRFLEGAERTQRVRVVKVPLPDAGPFEGRLEDLAAEKEKDRDEIHVEPRLAFLRLTPEELTRFEPGAELREEPGVVGPDGAIRVEATGDQVLYVGILEEGYTFVKRGAPGADGPVLNHFDAQAVRRYLDRMTKELGPTLGGQLGDALRATFVDSLELDFANWTGDLPAEFERRRGYALAPYLPFVLDVGGEGEGTAFADTVRRARYDFHRTVVELFQERFLSTYAQWCRDNGVLSRVQAYGRETHPIDGGLLIDIPEGESWFWGDHDRITRHPTVVNRYVSSAARLAGKRLTSHEAMTNAVPAFRVTLADMKLLLDKSLLTGVLHPIIHGFNYSPPEAGFPGWVRYGTWLSEQNPWWPHVRRLTDYSARLTAVLAESEGQARLALLGPRADEWARHIRLYQPFPEIAVPWYHYALPGALASAGYGTDFVSEKVLQESTATGGVLRFGPREWDGLLVLDAESLEPETARTIERFAGAGGRVLFVGRAPHRSPGLFEAEERDRAVEEAIEAARAVGTPRVAVVPAPDQGPLGTLDQTRRPLPGFARRQLLHWVSTTLPAFDLAPPVRIEAPHPDVAQLRHRAGDREIVFFANTSSSETVAFRAWFPSPEARPWRWDPETGDRAPYPVEEGTGALWIRLEPSESLLLVFEPEDGHLPEVEPVLVRPSLSPSEWRTVSGDWEASFRHAVGDRTFERTLRPLEDLGLSPDPELGTFAGTITYRTTFEVPDTRFDRLDLGEANGVTALKLNGEPLGVSWWGRHLYDTAGALQEGANTLEIEVTTVAANYVRSLEDNPAAQRWSWWYPPIPAGLVGPVRLVKTRP
jgi:hypothetical protein